MLCQISKLLGKKLFLNNENSESEFSISDFLFDGTTWNMKYAVIEKKHWFHHRRHLISPFFLKDFNDLSGDKPIFVDLTRQEVEKCPPEENDPPLSMEYKKMITERNAYYGSWGFSVDVPQIEPNFNGRLSDILNNNKLRSFIETKKYHLMAENEKLGHIKDALIDIRRWKINYLVVATWNYFSKRSILFSTKLIENISYFDRNIQTKIVKNEIKNAPQFIANHFSDLEEKKLADYYQKLKGA